MRAVVLGLVLAYVMPTYSVLKRLANARDDLTVTAMRLDSLGAVAPVIAKDVADQLGTTWTSGELTLTAVWSVRFPGRCRLDLSSPDSTKAMTFAWANGKKRSEGGELEAAAVAVDEACALLALRSGTDGESRGQLERHLAALKVNPKETTLARFVGGTVAFVIGDRTEGAPQLWVYKDGFLPARVRFTDDKGTQWDVRMVDYASQSTGQWFPRIIEVYKGAEPQLRLTVLSADGKAELEGVKF